MSEIKTESLETTESTELSCNDAFVDEKQFTTEIQKYYSGFSDNSKKSEWTSERILDVIELIDGFNVAKAAGKRPTNRQYYHAKKYDVMNIGHERVLITKSKSRSDPVVQIIPSTEYYQRILDAHVATGHGRRDKIVQALREKYMVPVFAITIFINLCKACLPRKSVLKNRSVVKPLISDCFIKKGPIDPKDLQASPTNEFHEWLMQNKDQLTKFYDSNTCYEVPIEVPADANTEDRTQTDGQPQDLTELNKQALQITLTRIKANPQLYIGIPKNCYHLVELLHKQTRISTVHILLCLKKVKLDTHFEELADQFGILASEAKQIFVLNIPLIANTLRSFITKLDNRVKVVQCNLPIPFRAKYQNAACIVNSLELKIQSTRGLSKKRSMVNESMKNNLTQSENINTVKYLISTSPDGFINYVSSGYEGRNSDEKLLENTKYLDRFQPGSCIVVKKGFQNVESILSKRRLKLLRPGVVPGPIPGFILFEKFKPILGLEDHVERVMQRVRDFTMVNEYSVISEDLVRVVDDAVIISCALINLQSFVIN